MVKNSRIDEGDTSDGIVIELMRKNVRMTAFEILSAASHNGIGHEFLPFGRVNDMTG